jgi:hypothetical protein
MKRLLIMAFLLSFLLVGCREPEREVMKKPVIYLYPEFTQEVEVKLDYAGELTCTYPEYNDGWHVVAHPNGMLENKENDKEYSYLFWEGNAEIEYDFSKGYVIAGDETAEFLEKKLAELGLYSTEANEFIVYWLPRMQGNKYNLITFQNEIYTEAAKLEITPEPDSILRVFMAYKPLEEQMEMEEPKIEPFHRKGFTVVEWGGTEVK